MAALMRPNSRELSFGQVFGGFTVEGLAGILSRLKEKYYRYRKGRIMNHQTYQYKSNQRFSRVPSCTFEIKHFVKLFGILSDLCREAAGIELSKLNENYQQANTQLTETEFETLKKDVKDSYKIHVEIVGTKGEYLTSDSSSIFKEEYLPDVVMGVNFDNSFFYKNAFDRNPSLLIDVKLDFSKPPLIDFITSPSFATTNNSAISFLGENETWVEGAHQKVTSFLEPRQNRRPWLHGKNIYDLFVWVLVIPLTLWNLRKFDLFASHHLTQYSKVLIVGVYIYIFFAALNIFRFAFNYMRWLFPYLELKTSLKDKMAYHRIIFFVIVTAIAGTLAKDLFVWAFKLLF